MSVPKIFRSSDVGAPVMLGVPGTLISLLDACLVDGYGGTFATGALTGDGTAPADGDTVTIGSITYTFKTSIAAQPAYSIAVGSNTNVSFQRLQEAIHASGTANYTAGTIAHPDVWVSTAGNVMSVAARKGGSAGNSIALARAAAGTPHISVSGATLTGGGGTNTKTSAGWTKPFTGPTAFAQAVYKQPAGCGFYLQVDDNGPGIGLGAEARTFGFETMSAYNVGTGQFPTVAQNTGGGVLHKAVFTARDVVRPWLLIADDRTFYLFIVTGDQSVSYVGYSFGDFYSFNPTDLYKCLVIGKNAESSSNVSTHPFPQGAIVQTTGAVSGAGHWLSRNFTGLGGPTAFVKSIDLGLSGASVNELTGPMLFPNGSDGGLYVAPVRIVDASTPAVSLTGNLNLRGRMRGLWHAPYPVASFADGDTFSGSGELAGRNFMVVKPVIGASGSSSLVVIETTAWDTSA